MMVMAFCILRQSWQVKTKDSSTKQVRQDAILGGLLIGQILCGRLVCIFWLLWSFIHDFIIFLVAVQWKIVDVP